MIRVIKADIFKLRKSKGIYVMAAVMTGILVLNVIMKYYLLELTQQLGGTTVEQSIFGQLISFPSDMIINAIIFVLVYFSDLQQRKISNMVAGGIDRQAVYVGKFVVFMALKLGYYVLITILSFVADAVFFRVPTITAMPIILYIGRTIGLYLILDAVYFVFFTTFSTWVKKTSGFIGIVIGIQILGAILFGLLDLIIQEVLKMKFDITDYVFYFLGNNFSEVSLTWGDMSHSLLVCAVSFVIFACLGIISLKHVELK